MPQLRLLPILLGLLVVSYATAAWSSVVAVDPIRIHLSVSKRTELVKLTNRGDKTARFQITAHSWHETPDGSMQLVPTRDLLFFPSLLEIGPGQTRRVRLASTIPPGRSERSYRIVVEELPTGNKVAGVVQVLTRLNVPVFVQPATPKPVPTLKTTVQGGEVRIVLENSGNAYFKAQSVRLIGRDRNGAVVYEQTLPGWYVLAYGLRQYSVVVPQSACASIVSLTTTATTEQGKTSAATRIAPEAACPR